MGIDIYLGGYDAYQSRSKDAHECFEIAIAERAKHLRGSVEEKAMQRLVDLSSEILGAGRMGYLRSSYNSGGLFNVLDRIFGTDSAALLFPGDWAEDIQPDWEQFLRHVRFMQDAALALRHGDPLPVAFGELMTEPSKCRAGGERFGEMVLGMVAEVAGAENVESGNPHAAGFYNSDDYEWYVTEGLDDLHAFAMRGRRMAARGEDTRVHISY